MTHRRCDGASTGDSGLRNPAHCDAEGGRRVVAQRVERRTADEQHRGSNRGRARLPARTARVVLDAVRPVAAGSTQRTAQARGAIRAGAR